MSRPEDKSPPSDLPPRRFRFRLKALFIVMTLLCVWLGMYVVRYRHSAAVVAQYRAVSDVLRQNMVTAPENTSFIRLDLPVSGSKQGADKWRFHVTETWGWLLDISKLPATDDIGKMSTTIRTHYEHGLAELGLVRTAAAEGATAWAIWELPQHGLYAVIDVRIDPALKQAHVRIIFLHNEKLSIL